MGESSAKGYDLHRNTRADYEGARPKTVNLGREAIWKRREIRHLALLQPYPEDAQRPATRGECISGPRPCPWVSCRHHLYLDAGTARRGSIQFNFPDKEPGDLEHSCSLDIADEGGVSLEEVGHRMNVVRERIRQLEKKALAHVAKGLVDQ